MQRLVSLLGIFVILGILFALSRNRKAISWRLVLTGLLIQGVLGTCFLYWATGNSWLRGLGEGVEKFLALSQGGTEFIWGPLADKQTLGFIHYWSGYFRRKLCDPCC